MLKLHSHITSPVLISCMLLLTSCSSIEEDKCREMDWRFVGFQDANKGYPMTHISQHEQACAEFNIKPNLPLYTAGYQTGIKNYCTANNGYHEGRANKPYQNQCPQELAEPFLAAFKKGQHTYELEEQIDKLETKQKTLNKEFTALTQKISDNKSKRQDASLDKAARKKLKLEMRGYQEAKKKVKNKTEKTAEKIKHLQKKIDKIQEDAF